MSFKLRQLRTLLLSLGASNSGPKNELLQRLKHALQTPRIRPKAGPVSNEIQSTGVNEHGRRTTRILSIDMGIQNLAYCVVDVTFNPTEHCGRKNQDPTFRSAQETISRQKAEHPTRPVGIHVQAWKVTSLYTPAEFSESKDLFEPAKLSQAAHKLVREKWLSWNPDMIIIERQRFRSMGGPMVQEWTLRVNMLEAMIFAVLRTMEAEKQGRGPAMEGKQKHEVEDIMKTSLDIYSVNPLRVGAFWLRGLQIKSAFQRPTMSSTNFWLPWPMRTPTTVGHNPKSLVEVAEALETQERTEEPKKKRGRRKDSSADSEETTTAIPSEDGSKATRKKRNKFEKKEHVQLVQSWLEYRLSKSTSATKTSPFWDTAPMQLTISAAAGKVALALLAKKNNTPFSLQKDTEQALEEDLEGPVKKLDDLADCLLQVAAWTAWEHNRMVMGGCATEDEWRAMEEASNP